MFLIDHPESPFRDFESYLSILVCFDEDDNQLILEQNKSYFTANEPSSGNYSIKDISEVLSRGFQNESESRGLI